ncbi:MAG: hypothetical protein IID06_01115 [Gemmatimonadetes bacterium]|nr:hypothetical protein [Gemmatimonadota bacterium]
MAKKTTKKTGDGVDAPEESVVIYHFIKSNLFRVVHADGAHGGVTPQGFIQMNFYSERFPIPRETHHRLEKNLPEIREERVARKGAVREVEVGVIMNASAATNLVKWLNTKIRLLKSIENQSAGAPSGGRGKK